ncbi:hypothetical protein BDD12DRAFT_890562 [Trichophaea hybrida]|nr:hypothetical protein BDD12DRAFT_890562 [Trichophaea hybrida]
MDDILDWCKVHSDFGSKHIWASSIVGSIHQSILAVDQFSKSIQQEYQEQQWEDKEQPEQETLCQYHTYFRQDQE